MGNPQKLGLLFLCRLGQVFGPNYPPPLPSRVENMRHSACLVFLRGKVFGILWS